jgi:hypothetical protein
MNYTNLKKSSATRSNPTPSVLQFGPWNRGLLTRKTPERAEPTGCGDLLNFVLVDEGLARTRPGLIELWDYGVHGDIPGEIRCIKDVKVNGVWDTYISSYRALPTPASYLYKWTGSALTLIFSFADERDIRFVGFNDLLIIFDGVHMKYYDGTLTGLIYDDGIGPAETSYQFTNRYGSDDESMPLGNATNTAIVYQFTTVAWETGFVIPPTGFYARLSKTGAGFTGTDNVPILFQLYQKAGANPNLGTDTKHAEATFLPMVGNLPTTGSLEYDILISPSSFLGGWTGLLPNTPYYVALSYANGNSSNYVNVHNSRVTGSTAGAWTGAWAATVTQEPIMALRPGADTSITTGLKAVDGIVHGYRLFVIEGESGSNPSYLWYSGASNHLDWSTPDDLTTTLDESGGGWMDAGKDVGGIASFYGEVWVFGTVRMPFLSRLVGRMPATWVLSESIQPVSGHYKSIVTAANDLYFSHPQGCDSVSTVQTFGDVRTVSQTDDIKNLFQEYFSEAAFAEYEPNFGLYLLKLDDGTDSIYAIHTKLKTAKNRGGMAFPSTPVSRWEFTPTWGPFPQDITCFGSGENRCYVGTDHGLVYIIDPSQLDDNGSNILFSLKTQYLSTVMGEAAAWKINFQCFGDEGGVFRLRFYVNHSRIPLHNFSVILPDISDGDDPTLFFDRENLNFNFRSLMVEIDNVVLDDGPIFFGPLSVLHMQVGGF